MRRTVLFVLLVLLLLPGVAGAAPAFVKAASATTGAVAASTIGGAFGSAVGSGALVAGCVTWEGNSINNLVTVTDNQANSYTIVRRLESTGFTRRFASFYRANVTNAPTTVTATFDSSVDFRGITVHEVSGVATSTPLDVEVGQFQTAPGTGANGITSTAVTTSQNGDYIFGCSVVTSQFPTSFFYTPGTNFTERVEAVGAGLANVTSEDFVQSTAGSIAATFTGTDDFSTISFIMAFKTAGGAGDVTAPTVPGSPGVTALSSSTTGVTWTASTDAVGVTQYAIERCLGAACSSFVEVSRVTSPTLAYTDSGLLVNTLYRYQVRAFDAAGNASGYSSIVQTTTLTVISATLLWNYTDNPAAPAGGFLIRRCVTTVASCTPATAYASPGPSARSFVDADSGQPVSCYDMQATRAGTQGSTFSNIICGPPLGTFTLTIAAAGSGTVTTTPVVGTTTVTAGTVVPLTAVAAANSDLAGTTWTGTGCTDLGGGLGTTTVSANRTCTATANLQTGDFAYVAYRGSATSTVSNSTIGLIPTATLGSGELGVLRCVSDNVATTSGQTNEHVSVADSNGNVWVKLREHTNAGGAAAGGVTASLWASKITTALTNSNTVTMTLSSARIAKACGLEQFHLVAGQTFSVAGAAANTTGTSTNPSAVVSGLASATYLFLGQVGVEGPDADTYTQDTTYQASTATGGTALGTATSNVATRFGFRRVTATGDTFNPTLGTSRDWTAMLVALSAIAQPTTFTITATKSGAGNGTVTINGVTTLGPVTFNSGTVVQIQAFPDISSNFTTWSTTSGSSCTGSLSGADPVQSVTLAGNTVCNVAFGTVPVTPGPWNLTIGSISGGGSGTTTPAVGSVTSFADGTVVNLICTAAAGNICGAWTGTGCTTGSVTMTAARTCTPTITLLPTFTLSMTKVGTGAGTVTINGVATLGPVTFSQGTQVPISATPLSGSTFVGWSGTGCPTGTTSPTTVLMNANRTCTATFNVVTASGPTGVLVPVPGRRCTINIEARLVSSVGIADVTWTIDDQTVAVQTTPTSSGAGLYTFFLRKTLVDEGSSLVAIAEDLAGQTAPIGPFVTVCP